MKKRFVFIEYSADEEGTVVSSHSMVFGDKTIEMMKITLSDFGKLYDALSKKKAAFPVKILRRLVTHLIVCQQRKHPIKAILESLLEYMI